MEASEVLNMAGEALRGMSVGLPGVFSVLAVFYLTLKLLMLKSNQKE